MVTVQAETLLPMVLEDLQQAQQLQSLLEQERTHLENREHKLLPSIIEAKEQCVAKLEHNQQRRNLLLSQLGQPSSAKAWEKLLQNTQHSQLLTTWNNLKDTLKVCREKNEINGKMIGRGQQSLTRIMSLLRGQSNTPQLYDNKGSSQSSINSHTIISA